MRRAGLVAAGIALLLCAARAHADSRVSLQANSDFPLDIGARVAVELPFRLRLSTSLGYMPPPYVRAANDVAVAAGAYERDVADIIENGLEDSLVWRTHVGWRPFADAGFYVDAGYGLIALGGRVNTAEALLALTGIPAPVVGILPDSRFEVNSTVHNLDVELGWEWVAAERLLVRLALGGAFTIAANSTVEPESGGIPLVSDAFGDAVADRLDGTYRAWLHVPTLSLGVGYVF